MSVYQVVGFTTDQSGRLTAAKPGGFRFIPDRSNTVEIERGKKYIVKGLKVLTEKQIEFVEIVTSARDLFVAIRPALLEASWQRGKDFWSDPWTTVEHPQWGSIEVKLHDSRGQLGRHLYIEIAIKREELTFTLGKTDMIDLESLSSAVSRKVGPTVNPSAALARQRERGTFRHR